MMMKMKKKKILLMQKNENLKMLLPELSMISLQL